MGEVSGQQDAILRERVQERYDAAALTVSRLRSAQEDEDYLDLDILPYYEGKRDALRDLLEAARDCAIVLRDGERVALEYEPSYQCVKCESVRLVLIDYGCQYWRKECADCRSTGPFAPLPKVGHRYA